MATPTLVARPLAGYALHDSGGGRKLESLAGLLVDRPSPMAVWRPRLEEDRWSEAVSRVERTKDGGGFWQHRLPEPGNLTTVWTAPSGHEVSFRLRLTSFGHCGLFFEQEPLWRGLHHACASRAGGKALNLFGYTGAASLAMAAAGAEVFHVDSAKGVLTWGQESVELTGDLPGTVRWVHEDCLAFLAHSRKRGFRYEVVFADPPAWGHGKDKQQWRFEDHCQTLIDACVGVLAPRGLLVVAAHGPGIQAPVLVNCLIAAGVGQVVVADLAQVHAEDPRLLPAGVVAAAGEGAETLAAEGS